MSNNSSTPPFQIGEEVVCVKVSGNYTGKTKQYLAMLELGKTYTIEAVVFLAKGWALKLAEINWSSEVGGRSICGLPLYLVPNFHPSRFRRIPPYQESAIKSLAEQAMQSVKDNQDAIPNPIEVDKPIKEKEVHNAV